MARLDFCEHCCDERVQALWNNTNWFQPCNDCIEGREQYRARLHMDRAYRSHLARQIAGYPCHITSQCPHHPPGYHFFHIPYDDDHLGGAEDCAKANGYYALVKEAFDKLRRSSSSSITALELLSAHESKLLQYCKKCYHAALDAFEAHADVTLCEHCLARRRAFISQHHSHQAWFLQRKEVLWKPRDAHSLWCSQEPPR